MAQGGKLVYPLTTFVSSLKSRANGYTAMEVVEVMAGGMMISAEPLNTRSNTQANPVTLQCSRTS